MNENKLKILIDGLIEVVRVLSCKLTCCKSSCNTEPEKK